MEEFEKSLLDNLLSPSSGLTSTDFGVFNTSGSSVSGEVMCMSWKYCIRGSVILRLIFCRRSFTGDLISSLRWRRRVTVWLLEDAVVVVGVDAAWA